MVTIPIEVWMGEGLKDGDLIEVDIRKVKREAPLPREESVRYD